MEFFQVFAKGINIFELNFLDLHYFHEFHELVLEVRSLLPYGPLFIQSDKIISFLFISYNFHKYLSKSSFLFLMYIGNVREDIRFECGEKCFISSSLDQFDSACSSDR